MKYCPNCVSEMKEDNKKMGRFTKWLICVSCGYRTRFNGFIETPHILDNVTKQKDEEDDYE